MCNTNQQLCGIGDRGANERRHFAGYHTYKQRPAGEKVRRKLGCNGCDMVEFRSMRGGSKAKKQDHSLRLQEGRLWPVSVSVWKNHMVSYGIPWPWKEEQVKTDLQEASWTG